MALSAVFFTPPLLRNSNACKRLGPPSSIRKSAPRLRALASLLSGFALALFAPLIANSQELTAILELETLSAESRTVRPINLTANVWFHNAQTGHLILHDSTGTAEFQLDLQNASPQLGDRITISGTASILKLGTRYDISPLAVADNDGLHGEEEKSATLNLDSGTHPIRVEWFNAIGEPGLHVEYQGPNIERDPIPDSALYRSNPSASGQLLPGLNYKTFHGRWWALPPNLQSAPPALSGHSANFDLSVTPRKEFLAVTFDGFLKIDEPGSYTFYLLSDDGSRLFIGPSSLAISSAPATAIPKAAQLYPGQALSPTQTYLWTEMEGLVTRANTKENHLQLTLGSTTESVRVEIANAPPSLGNTLLNHRVRLTGVARRSLSLDGIPMATALFVQDGNQVKTLSSPPSSFPLTPIHEIERLDREFLKNGYTVRIQGVVTNPIPGGYAIVIQGEKRAIFVDLNKIRPAPIEQGDLLEIVGEVDAGEFSPFINATSLKRLGSGVMPAPLIATRDEILNGSLHSQYVEIEGCVLAVSKKTLTLRTRAGVLNIDVEIETSQDWLNAILRLRGCLRSFWDSESREIEVGKIELNSAEISVLKEAPTDLFAVKQKSASELLKFDPNASVFQRVALVGQVLQSDGPQLYLADQSHGVRVSLAASQTFQRGDIIEISGFPEFDGPSPHFAHSHARKLGQHPLPNPLSLPPDSPLKDEYDSTLVSVEGDLIGLGFQEDRWSLQLRFGTNIISAPIAQTESKAPRFEPGSRLKLSGVYVGLGGNRTLSQPIEAFEILLNSTADVQVLATPPWWTMPRLLALVGALLVILLLSFVWIKSLRRQVAVRSKQLSLALEERHRIEQEEAVSRERSRLAYDLHDELGAGLTEVGLLGALATTASLPTEKRESHLARLTDKVRRLVMALDEIVWAVNPNYDSVSSFVDYYTSYAHQFLELANVRCRFDVAEDLPEEPLGSRVRHSLFLAFKETLNNVARHAHATEVVIRIFPEGNLLVVSISDNGCGLHPDNSTTAKDGLDSIRDRLTQLGGHCVVESPDKQGTTISLKLPLQ